MNGKILIYEIVLKYCKSKGFFKEKSYEGLILNAME